MFRITAKSCRTFTFAEVLIMAAINVETMCASQSKTAADLKLPQCRDDGRGMRCATQTGRNL